MQITDIVQQKGRYTIYLNDEPAFWLYKQELNEYDLCVYDEVSDEIVKEIMHSVIGKRAKLRSMKLLEKRDYTKQQLRHKLKESGYPTQVIDDAIEYVSGYRYLDDLRFAENYVHQYAATKSVRQIKTSLMEKGVSSEDIERVLSEAELPMQEDLIRYWIEKKHYDPENSDEKIREKMMGFLLRKGFSYSDIRKVL